jgi:hypothetical protein
VKVYLGKKRKEFVIHKKLLCNKSDFFRKAFTGSFKEGEGVIYLPDDSPGPFSIFIDWLYRSTIPPGHTEEYFNNLFKLYIFASKLCLNELADGAIDRIRDMVHKYDNNADITPALVDFVYSKTSTESPLRTYCIHGLAFNLWDHCFPPIPARQELAAIWQLCRDHKEFFEEFFTYIKFHETADGVPDPSHNGSYKSKSCFFHRHGDQEQCYLSQRNRAPREWIRLSEDDRSNFFKEETLDNA